MSVRQAPRAQTRQPEEFWEPVPTAAGGGARLAQVLAAGERRADATGTKAAERWQAAGNKVKMAAKMTPPAAPAAKPPSWLEKMGAKVQENAVAYRDQKAADFKKWKQDWKDEADALKDLRESTVLAAKALQKFGRKSAYYEVADEAFEKYKTYRQLYWLKTREGKAHAEVPLSDAVLKELYRKYEREVYWNETRNKYKDPMGVPETIACGFDDDDALLAAEMEAAGTALCCEEEDADVGCGWDAVRRMRYPCAMVFTMIGADGVTRLYCASTKPPSAYDNASQLHSLSHFSSELHEMLEEIAGMWPNAPSYTNYVLVPAGQSEPEPEPKPPTQLRIPISELEGEGGAEKLTAHVMNWLKQLNVKVNEDKKTNEGVDAVTTRRGAVGVPINAGRMRKFKDTADADRVARQLQAAFRARRAARAQARVGADQ